MLTKNSSNPVLIHHARIIDVNVSTYTVNVATEFTKKLMTDVSFNVPYTHPNNGEGIYFMPEVGSLCWLCEPSDGSMPFVLGWTSGQDETDFSARKQGLNPGDIYLGTRDENFLWLRRGGVVQIGSTGICQRIYMPVNNTINDFCENYNLHTLGGDLTWNIQRSETDTTGDRPALFTLAARQFADDQNPIATLEIGSQSSNSNTILSLSIMASGAQGAAQQISLQMDDQGNVTWAIQMDWMETISGKFTSNVTGDIAITSSQGNVDIESSTGTAKLGASTTATIEAGAEVDISAPLTSVSQMLQVAGGGIPFALATPGFLVWLASHTHLCTAPGAPSGPPVPPCPPMASLMASSGS
jgi:hypothetical protein